MIHVPHEELRSLLEIALARMDGTRIMIERAVLSKISPGIDQPLVSGVRAGRDRTKF